MRAVDYGESEKVSKAAIRGALARPRLRTYEYQFGVPVDAPLIRPSEHPLAPQSRLGTTSAVTCRNCRCTSRDGTVVRTVLSLLSRS